MRGKKTDPEFVSNFIQESASLGYNTTESIIQRATQEIEKIDNQIKEIEKLKSTRSKLLDVVNTFDKTVKSKQMESNILPFFKLDNPNLCILICKSILKNTINSDNIDSSVRTSVTSFEYIFTKKQLQEAKVLSRIGDKLVPGDKFDEYMKFVMHEVK